jgi:hypothetical protein
MFFTSFTQIVKKFPASQETRRSVTVLNSPNKFPLSDLIENNKGRGRVVNTPASTTDKLTYASSGFSQYLQDNAKMVH